MKNVRKFTFRIICSVVLFTLVVGSFAVNSAHAQTVVDTGTTGDDHMETAGAAGSFTVTADGDDQELKLEATGDGGDVVNSGTLDASGVDGAAGGEVRVIAEDTLRLEESSLIKATGDAGASGGFVEVSGFCRITPFIKFSAFLKVPRKSFQRSP